MRVQRIAEVPGLVWLCGACGFFFATSVGKCKKIPLDWYEDGNLTLGPEYGFRFQCEEGYHNDMASLFLSSTHDTIIRLFSLGHDDAGVSPEGGPPVPYEPSFSIGALALYTCVYLVLLSIGAGLAIPGAGLAIPGGLFMPSIVLGASWGAMWGQTVRLWLPSWNVQPGLYALLAATGVLGGVFRSAMSLVVLMVEGTRGVDYIFGIILAVVVANYVAHHIHQDGVYESELERIGNVFMLRDEPPHRLHTSTAGSIMASGVIGFRAVESVARVMEVLRAVQHNGFPVFMRESDLEAAGGLAPGGESHRLEGVILRSQLLVLMQRRHFCDADGRPVGREPNENYELELETEMRTFYRRYYTHSRYLSATHVPLDSLHLDTPDSLFVGLGLRHLLVLDSHNNVAGIITRKDLDHAAGHGWWRLSHMAEAPKNGMRRLLERMGFVSGGGAKTVSMASGSGGGYGEA
eukprot:gene1153-3718_t